jgi:hypothetical protein
MFGMPLFVSRRAVVRPEMPAPMMRTGSGGAIVVYTVILAGK